MRGPQRQLDENAPRTFCPYFFLAQTDAAASFKVYVILSTSNEADSHPLPYSSPSQVHPASPKSGPGGYAHSPSKKLVISSLSAILATVTRRDV